MAAAAAQPDTENHRASDRLTLATYDQRQAMDDWLQATISLQRDYLDWVSKTFRMVMPQTMFGQQSD